MAQFTPSKERGESLQLRRYVAVTRSRRAPETWHPPLNLARSPRQCQHWRAYLRLHGARAGSGGLRFQPLKSLWLCPGEISGRG